jgi:hypothetical protein
VATAAWFIMALHSRLGDIYIPGAGVAELVGAARGAVDVHPYQHRGLHPKLNRFVDLFIGLGRVRYIGKQGWYKELFTCTGT